MRAISSIFKLDKVGLPALFILVLMISVGPFGDTEYAPSIPRIAHELGSTIVMIQYSMTSYLAGFAISQILYGPLSQKYGRKPWMLIGACIFILGSLICLFSFSAWMLIVGRLVQGVGSCSGAVLTNTIVSDAFPIEERSHIYAKVNAAYALAPALGPIVGAIIDEYLSWHFNFLILVILGIFLLLCVWWMLPETNKAPDPNALKIKNFILHYLHLFKDPYYFALVIIKGLAVGIIYVALTAAPTLAINVLKLSAIWVLPIAGGVLVGFVAGSLLCNSLTRYISSKWVVFYGLAIMLITSIIYLIFNSFGLLSVSITVTIVCVAVIFVGIAMVIPIATAKAFEPFVHTGGSAAAMSGCIGMGLGSLSTAALGFFPDGNTASMPLLFVILSGISCIIYVGLVMMRSGHARVDD